MAPRMPLELYVAPETASTSQVWAWRTRSITPFALLRNSAVSPGALRTWTAVIFLAATVTWAVISPP